MSSDAKERVGQVVVQGQHAKLVFQRHISQPPEVVWKALTDPGELSVWYMTKAVIDGREDGSIDFMSGPSRLHVTGRILTWDPPHVFEHEWKVGPRFELPSGENAVIKWELISDENGTILTLEHRNLNEKTAIGIAPGTHAFLDRLEARLLGKPLPGWQERYTEASPHYPASWVSSSAKDGEEKS